MLNLEYNTQQPHLLMAEYGRGVKKMIEHALTITDKEERTLAAETIINVMALLNPTTKEMPNYKNKLWDHLHLMSDYKLDVNSPYPIPEKEVMAAKPEPVGYPRKKIMYKHYGYNMELFIKKAMETSNDEQREEFKQVLAHLMKKSYLTWNRDTVADEIIAKHLIELSNGKLMLDDEFKFLLTQDILKTTVPTTSNYGTGNKKKKKKKNNNKSFYINNNNSFLFCL
jgi:Domain of unknown function (DUF4290)